MCIRDSNTSFREVKDAQRSIKESEAKIRGIIDSALDAVVVINSEGFVTEWNSQAEKIFGWSKEEAFGSNLANLIIPENLRDAHNKGMKKFHATGEGPVLNTRVEVPAVNKDGKEFPVELTVIPIEVNGVYTFSAFIRDITDRKAAEEALASEKERLSVTLNSIGEGVVVTDNDGRITLINPIASEMLEVEEDQLLSLIHI